jgi:hypothetical protein
MLNGPTGELLTAWMTSLFEVQAPRLQVPLEPGTLRMAAKNAW